MGLEAFRDTALLQQRERQVVPGQCELGLGGQRAAAQGFGLGMLTAPAQHGRQVAERVDVVGFECQAVAVGHHGLVELPCLDQHIAQVVQRPGLAG